MVAVILVNLMLKQTLCYAGAPIFLYICGCEKEGMVQPSKREINEKLSEGAIRTRESMATVCAWDASLSGSVVPDCVFRVLP